MAKSYKIGTIIKVSDRMQKGYSYRIDAPAGKKFDKNFTPHFTPKEMLELGVFEGKYCNDCRKEFPKDWYAKAKIGKAADPSLNYFGVKSRQPLSIWQDKGWIVGPDPRGWFQWYCRYWLGRRLPEVDKVQNKTLARLRTPRRTGAHPLPEALPDVPPAATPGLAAMVL